jgi:hypothetical protein
MTRGRTTTIAPDSRPEGFPGHRSRTLTAPPAARARHGSPDAASSTSASARAAPVARSRSSGGRSSSPDMRGARRRPKRVRRHQDRASRSASARTSRTGAPRHARADRIAAVHLPGGKTKANTKSTIKTVRADGDADGEATAVERSRAKAIPLQRNARLISRFIIATNAGPNGKAASKRNATGKAESAASNMRGANSDATDGSRQRSAADAA